MIGYLFILTPLALAAISAALYYADVWRWSGDFFAVVFSITTLLVSILAGVNWVSTSTLPDQQAALQQTLDAARERGPDQLEMATIQRDAMEFNRELARHRALDAYFDPFISDKVHDTPFVR